MFSVSYVSEERSVGLLYNGIMAQKFKLDHLYT